MKGFTLLETLLYIALLSIVLTGGITTAFQLLQSTSTDSSYLATYDEGVFVLQKISWALSQTASSTQILSPAPVSHSDTLHVVSQNGSHIVICRAAETLFVYEDSRTPPPCGDTPFAPITHTHTIASGFDVFIDTSHLVHTAIILNGIHYTTTTYVP